MIADGHQRLAIFYQVQFGFRVRYEGAIGTIRRVKVGNGLRPGGGGSDDGRTGQNDRQEQSERSPIISRVRGHCFILSRMLLIEDRGRVRWLTLRRPERKNAIPPEGWDQLRDAFADFEDSPQRVLVVTGAGGDFCAGADLGGGRPDRSMGALRARMRRVGEAALALHRLTKPTVAAVDGVAVGAGMNLALGCDLVIATDRARFSEIFVRRGLTVDFGGTWLLPRIVGLPRAKELALTGRMVEAAEAVRIGLVLEAVAPQDLEGRVAEWAEQLAAAAPVGQMFAKQGLDAAHESGFAEALDREGQAQAVCLGGDDATEGIRAFLERRPPQFTGR